MNDAREQQLHEALDRMEATALSPYHGADISQLIRRLLNRQSEAQRQLRCAAQELQQVAELLRDQRDQPTPKAIAARQEIAGDFAEGARELEQAYAALMTATQNLSYLQYRFL
ncbi:hypothetical protein [Deinococcus sp. Leaf326]|uniref:hypothetical protein n=1 Tax=Deinococcus sp. Leaf326 TaxID=1736338 RepID=UPI0012E1F0E0|nr:hypothetical protein [Deinococcus sp. Leaf326]